MNFHINVPIGVLSTLQVRSADCPSVTPIFLPSWPVDQYGATGMERIEFKVQMSISKHGDKYVGLLFVNGKDMIQIIICSRE